jgi:hypothetical protein
VKGAVPFWHTATTTLFDLVTYVVDLKKPDQTVLLLTRVDFSSNQTIILTRFNVSSIALASFDDENGVVYGIVDPFNAPRFPAAIDVTSGKFTALPDINYDRWGHLETWMSWGWNSKTKMIDILIRDDESTINGQNNFTVAAWNPATGEMGAKLPKFLFPPANQFFGRVDLVSSTYDSMNNILYTSISDRQDTVGILGVDSKTGQPVAFGEFDVNQQPRQMVVAH